MQRCKYNLSLSMGVLIWRLCDLSRTVIYVPAVVCRIGATTMTPNPSPTRAMQTWPESCRSISTVSCMGRATSAWTTLMKCWPRNCRHAPGRLHHATASLLPTVACMLFVKVEAAVPCQRSAKLNHVAGREMRGKARTTAASCRLHLCSGVAAEQSVIACSATQA